MAEFDVKCNSCNEYLDAYFATSGRDIILEITPCERCLEEADARGYKEGYERDPRI